MKYILILIIIVIFTIGCTKNTTESTTRVQDAMEQITPVEEVFSGYLMDVTCGTSGKGLDGANVVTNPQEHTIHCLDICAPSGFGIMVPNEDGETFSFIKFDSSGTNLANNILETLNEGDSTAISVKGFYKDNIISVSELNPIN